MEHNTNAIAFCVYAENIDDGYRKRKKEKLVLFSLLFSMLASFFFPMNKQLRRKMKRPFGALEVNTIPAPIGRSTWLCTITHNNNKIGHTDGVEREAQEFLPSVSTVTTTTTTVDPMHNHNCEHCISFVALCPFTSSSAYTNTHNIIYIVSVSFSQSLLFKKYLLFHFEAIGVFSSDSFVHPIFERFN